MEKFISINLSIPITVLIEPLIIILLPMLMILVVSWRRSLWY